MPSDKGGPHVTFPQVTRSLTKQSLLLLIVNNSKTYTVHNETRVKSVIDLVRSLEVLHVQLRTKYLILYFRVFERVPVCGSTIDYRLTLILVTTLGLGYRISVILYDRYYDCKTKSKRIEERLCTQTLTSVKLRLSTLLDIVSVDFPFILPSLLGYKLLINRQVLFRFLFK